MTIESAETWNTTAFGPFFPIAGVATRVGEHLVVRGGVQFRRPFGEGLSLFETFAGVGYRF